MDTRVLQVRTGTRLVTDITAQVRQFARDRSAGRDGLLHVFLPHATAGLALLETGSGSEADLERVVDVLLPRDPGYRHRHGSPGHGRDHVLPAWISPSISLPVLAGEVALGTWQSLVVVDPNRDNPVRDVRLSLLPG